MQLYLSIDPFDCYHLILVLYASNCKISKTIGGNRGFFYILDKQKTNR